MVLDHFFEEASIAWSFTRRDLTATVVPFSLFTLASSLEAGSPPWKNACKSAILGFLLLYTFTISNQINGIEEDRLNKPDRPIASGRVGLRGAYARYIILTFASLIFSYSMNVEAGAISFMTLGAIHNFTRASSFGPTKDFVTSSILTVGLHSAWKIGGGTSQKGLIWIICLAVNLLFSISIQDLRDVVGDSATGRHTTPIMLGKPYGRFIIHRIYISASMLFIRATTLKKQYLQSNNYYASRVCAFIVIMADLFLVFRTFRFQSISEDKKTYRLYMLRFSLELLLASFVLAA